MSNNEIQVLAFIGCIFVGIYLGMQYPELRLRDMASYFWNRLKEKIRGQNKTTTNN